MFDAEYEIFSSSYELRYVIFVPMEVKYLRLIKVIAEEGTIANATEKLFLTQSALSHQLRELEERLGFKVFHRKRNAWQLTVEGKELYAMANEVLTTITKRLHAIENIREGSKGTVKIGTECYSFYHGLPAFVQKMGLLYPEISVELILEATHRPLSKLLAKEIDIALISSPSRDEQLSSIALFEDELLAILHKEHPLSTQSYIVAEDFAKAHLLIHSFPLESVSIHTRYLQPHQVTPAKVTAIPLTEVALEMVHANMGIMCMPQWALAHFRLSEDLVFRRISKEGIHRRHYLTYRTEDRNKRYIMDFIANFEETFIIE